MNLKAPKIPLKYQPKGFKIIHEDLDIIVGIKSAGLLTVGALWEKENTVHNLLNKYIRKGNARSSKSVYVVHRLDQATTGILIFAKNLKSQEFLKNNWKQMNKTYYAIVHGQMKLSKGMIESYLSEDEDYVVQSNQDKVGKFSQTEYEVIKTYNNMSLLKVNLLTGRKNQIRVHMSEAGCPIVGDQKYGQKTNKFKDLALHSYSLEISHPHTRERMLFEAPLPDYFQRLVPYKDSIKSILS